MATTSPYGLKTTHVLNDPGLVADINEIAGALNDADGRIASSLQPGNLTVKASRDLAISGAGTSASPLVIDSPYRWVGSGSPYGSLTPDRVGIEYIDTAQTSGARKWISTGTTSTSWVVTDGNTGWVEITSRMSAGIGASAHIYVMRTNSIVSLAGLNVYGSSATTLTFTLPTAFAPQKTAVDIWWGAVAAGGQTPLTWGKVNWDGSACNLTVTTSWVTGITSWPTPYSWPTTLSL